MEVVPGCLEVGHRGDPSRAIVTGWMTLVTMPTPRGDGPTRGTSVAAVRGRRSFCYPPGRGTCACGRPMHRRARGQKPGEVVGGFSSAVVSGISPAAESCERVSCSRAGNYSSRSITGVRPIATIAAMYASSSRNFSSSSASSTSTTSYWRLRQCQVARDGTADGARAIGFSTLQAIWEALKCEVGEGARPPAPM